MAGAKKNTGCPGGGVCRLLVASFLVGNHLWLLVSFVTCFWRQGKKRTFWGRDSILHEKSRIENCILVQIGFKRVVAKIKVHFL